MSASANITLIVKLQPNAGISMHYTYLHRRASDGTPFYIGKGSGKRAYVKASRSKFWQSTVDKHGLKVEICAKWPTEEEAYQHERLLIECFQGMGFRLCNLTAGGDGLRSPTPELRAKMSASQRKRMQTTDARAKLSAVKTGVPRSLEHTRKIVLATTGKKRSDEIRKRMSASALSAKRTKKNIGRSVPVVCQELGLSFESCTSAAQWLTKNGYPKAERRAISRTAAGERKSAYGYAWNFSKEK